ncbi:hypothetical protein ACHAWF_013510 [Thalassiosira exigua]
MKAHRLLGVLAFLALLPAAEAFVLRDAGAVPRRATTRLRATKPLSGPLYLHVDALHPRRDSVARLDDPMDVDALDDGEVAKVGDEDEALHSFTYHLAPVALALYLIGHYLSNRAPPSELVHGGNVDVDPMFGGFVLVGAGLAMVKWSVDQTFLSPA